MTEFVFDFGEPALPDLNDSQQFNLGVRFTVSEDAPCTGVRWRVPDTLPVGTCKIQLYAVTGTALLATKDVTYSAPGLTNKLFDAQQSLTAGQEYLATIFTPNRYVATTNYAWPHTDGLLTAVADNGWLQFDAVYPDVQSGNSANYHVSPIIDLQTTVASAGIGRFGAAGRVAAIKRATGAGYLRAGVYGRSVPAPQPDLTYPRPPELTYRRAGTVGYRRPDTLEFRRD